MYFNFFANNRKYQNLLFLSVKIIHCNKITCDNINTENNKTQFENSKNKGIL